MEPVLSFSIWIRENPVAERCRIIHVRVLTSPAANLFECDDLSARDRADG